MNFLKNHKENSSSLLYKQPQPTAEPDYTPRRPDEGSMWENARSFIWETIKVIIISLLIILPVRYFLIQPFYVQGASMEPNFHDNEYLIIDEISYRFNEPRRGDIVVFRYPRDPNQFFIKRVVGLPGEEVQIRDGKVRIINQTGVGFVLDESEYLSAGVVTNGSINIRLKVNEFYVLGDNRGSSLDSRSFGPLDSEAIVGKAWLRGWPLNRLTVFDRPVYEFGGIAE